MGSLNDTAISVEKLIAGYGSRRILNGVDLRVRGGEIVAVIGPNGAGKSTLLKTLFGLLPRWSGSLDYSGFSGVIEPRALLRHGVVFSPQGNRVFRRLSVLENLQLAAAALERAQRRASLETALRFFPKLKDKLRQRAGTLSGGEKQTLALACAMSVEPQLLLLDEPSLGLSPTLTREVMDRLSNLAREAGVGCLVVEQKVREVLQVADQVYALRDGEVVFAGPAEQLRDTRTLREIYLSGGSQRA